MFSENLIASAKYDDFTGTSAADWHDDHSKMLDLAAENGFGINSRFVIGYRMTFGENMPPFPQSNKVMVSILYVDGEGSLGGMQKVVDEHDGVLTYRSFTFETTLEKAFDVFKRCEIVLTRPLRVSSYARSEKDFTE